MASRKIMFVAGDPSGDVHASHVIRSLREKEPDTECYGVGGQNMVAAGLSQLVPFEPFNCMGFLEVFKSLPFLLKAKHLLLKRMKQDRPAAVVLVDYASFNIPLLKAARRLGLPVVWYIAPKVWAWKEKRAAVIGNHASAIATIFPFEVKCFEAFPARTEFVGNPLVEDLNHKGRTAPPLPSNDKPGAYFRMAIVPGSRRQEVNNMLGPMLDAYLEARRSYRQMRAVVSRCPWLPDRLYEQCRNMGGVDLFEGPLDELFSGTDLALVTSGTATLEAALRGIPHVIAYRTSTVSYRIYRSLIKVPFIGLPNIVAGRALLPECIQDQANADTISKEIRRFINDRAYYMSTRQQLVALREELGSKRPSQEVARLVSEFAAERGRREPTTRSVPLLS